MEKIKCLLRLHWKWIAGLIIVGVVVGLVVLLFTPDSRDLSRYQALLDRGIVNACMDELNQQLKEDPSWHEGRAFLAEVEIEQGRLESAAGHIILLAKAEYNTVNLEVALVRKGSPLPLAVLAHAFTEDWHWPRHLYIQVALGSSQYVSALTEMNYLAEKGVNVRFYEDNLMLALQRTHPSPKQEVREALTEGEWALAFSLRYALTINDLEYVSSAYRTLMESYPNHSLLEETWKSMLKKNQLAMAWNLADTRKEGIEEVILGFYALQEQGEVPLNRELVHLNWEGQELHSFILPKLLGMEEEGYSPTSPADYAQAKLSALLDYSRSNKIKAAQVGHIEVDDLRTFMKGKKWMFSIDEPRFQLVNQILSFLAEEGDTAAIQEYRNELYSELPPIMLSSSQMDTVAPEILSDLVGWWLCYYKFEESRDCILTVVGYLKKKPGWARYASYCETAVNPPSARVSPTKTLNPEAIWPHQDYWITDAILSPDGRFLYISAIEPESEGGWAKQEVLDMSTGNLIPLPLLSIDSYNVEKHAAWSQDSQFLALNTAMNTIAVYDLTQGKQFAEVKPENAKAEINLLGWSEEEKLVWAEVTGQETNLMYQVVSYDCAAKERVKIGINTKETPFITPTGRLAYLDGIREYGMLAKTLKVTIDGTARTYEIPDGMSLIGWLPDDAGLHLSKAVLYFDSGTVNIWDVPLFCPFSEGWKNSYQVYGFFPLGGFEDRWGHHEVMLLDTRDMSLTHAGFHFYYGKGGQIVIDSAEQKIKIYRLW